MNAAVTVQAAGLLQPGLAATAGALAVSSVTWSADARFSPLVNGTASVLRATGVNGLTVPSGAAVARVDVVNVSLAVGTYTVIDYAGAIQGGRRNRGVGEPTARGDVPDQQHRQHLHRPGGGERG